ncbi:glutathione S-transferase [Brevundimonas sp. LM2]|uniref:glutathione S-transferase n=1 Tax=Brevundimonas sp. LM2 TaxID=1938605 RepID=UPI000983B306|nr:glutathione S-transferase [Brevundimonas sp. LM2]AQR62885.1 glutathione S-transferase [Brevundimonas sp. LM2]
MSDYTLYYWSVPFRGQFVRAVLAFAGQTWTEADDDAIADLMDGPPADMPVPFMGPPILVDHRAEVALSQMPAILLYLGETLELLPDTPGMRALALKVVNDANDVIDDLTLDGGRLMWTDDRWATFEPRLRKWMGLWEETGRRHGLTTTAGHLLGGARPGLADVVTATLWTTMADRFPPLEAILDEAAPMTAALSRRVAALPPLVALAQRAASDYGEAWSGGQIETSLRAVLERRAARAR